MLLFKQLELFATIVGEAVSFPRFTLSDRKREKLTAAHAIPATVPARSGRDPQFEAQAHQLLHSLGEGAFASRVRVEWSNRLRTAAGRADFRRTLITLNPRLREHGAAEIDRTFRHELAHLLAQARAGRRRIRPHGAEWRTACRDLGIANEPRCHTLPFPRQTRARPFLYRCPRCAHEFRRVRRIRRGVACLSCCRRHNGGRYDKQFQLLLVQAKRAI